MMQRVINYLSCCCTSRKSGKGLYQTSGASDILVGSGRLDLHPATYSTGVVEPVESKKQVDLEQERSLEAEKARYADEFQKALEKQITIIGIQLIKKSGLACTLEKFQETYPSPDMIVAIDKSLNNCSEHPAFEVLRDIVRNGPSDENREAAEQLSNRIAKELIDECCIAETSCTITEVTEPEQTPVQTMISSPKRDLRDHVIESGSGSSSDSNDSKDESSDNDSVDSERSAGSKSIENAQKKDDQANQDDIPSLSPHPIFQGKLGIEQPEKPAPPPSS